MGFSDKLGPEAGWAGLTGLASRRVAGWAGPETSDRPNQAIVSTFSSKMDPWSWTPTSPENFRTGFWASRHGWGGAGKILVGGGWGRGKAKILFGEEI